MFDFKKAAWLLAAGGAASFMTVAAAQAQSLSQRSHRQIPSWYLALGGTVNFVDDVALSENNSGTISRGDVAADDGVGFFGAIGYRPRYTNSFLDNMRFEVEAGRMSNDVEAVTSVSGTLSALSGDIDAQRYMANMYIDLDASTQIRPYVGAGLGGARISMDGDEDTVFAYQAMAGGAYVPSSFPILEFALGYRYFEAGNVELTSSSSSGAMKFDYSAHSLEAAMRAYF